MSRASALLRKYINGDEKTPGWEQRAAMQRLAVLKRKRQWRGVGGMSSADEAQLTWDKFIEPAEQSLANNNKALEREKTNIRPQWSSFVKTCREIAGDGTQEELNHAVHVIFKALTLEYRADISSKKTKVKPRELLEKYFGVVSPTIFARAVSGARKLWQWRQPFVENSPTSTQSEEKGASRKRKKERDTEFGASLSFVDPSVFAPQQLQEQLKTLSLVDSDVEEDDAELKVSTAENIAHFSMDPSKGTSHTARGGQRGGRSDGAGRSNQSDKVIVDANTTRPHVPGEFDLEWLTRKCETFATFSPTGEALITEHELARSCLAQLQSKASDVAVQNDLLNILGMDGIEFVGFLLQNRRHIVADNSKNASGRRGSKRGKQRGGQAGPKIGVTVRRQGQAVAEKMTRKLERKMKKLSQAAGNNTLDMDRLEQQARALDHMIGDSTTLSSGAPLNSERTQHKDYEEVHVPPVIPKPVPPSALVPISSLDEYAQIAFRGIKTLNRLQSACFDCAYNTNHNMLICAPTGAGKTNVAMLTVLHEVHQHLHQGVLQRDNFKIVYVAPMKALAQEVVSKFSRKLAPLGIKVRELTGDMQLTKREIKDTQMIVTTPEKWDVVTRKSGDGSLMPMVRLLIIDEVHLLHEERGPVLEILVARTRRQVESSQQMTRIVGISATLPNYADVAAFLWVNPKRGLFHFGNEYRPVPLDQYYIGVKDPNSVRRKMKMNEVAWRKALASLKQGNQVMIFVHSRRDTAKTAEYMLQQAEREGWMDLFGGDESAGYEQFRRKVAHSRNRDLKALMPKGFGIHHAGMTRPDRAIVEAAFGKGVLQLLVCTATLAWGVNLPAHTVIIKGTQIYNAKRGGFVEMGMLDVMQIFGRAGRPQFDTTGEGIIITGYEQLHHYLRLLNHAMPIESQFISALPDHLNAEIILGTVTNFREAVDWLKTTYLYIRMLRNPLAYGLTYEDKGNDPLLLNHCHKLIQSATTELSTCRMVRHRNENFFSTDTGRVASHYYIHHESMRKYVETLRKGRVTREQLFDLLAGSKEFSQIKQRDEETDELAKMTRKYCPVKVLGGLDSPTGKANVLLQTFISRAEVRESTLVSDMYFIKQSAGRITRALFELALKQGNASLAAQLLTLCKELEWRIWSHLSPLRQFSALKPFIVEKLEARNLDIDQLVDMEPSEIGSIVRVPSLGGQIARYVSQIPYIHMQATIQPITRDVLKITVNINADFEWRTKLHGPILSWWIWCEDADNFIYHRELFLLHAQKAREEHVVEFTIPVREPLPSQYYLRAVSDRWLGSETHYPLSFKHLMLPEAYPPHTQLLPLQPLPVSALRNPQAEKLYPFTHFNPVQTQSFHCAYHSDENMLMGAPTGSGKTIVGELCMLRLFSLYPHLKVVYICPMKALARERVTEWNKPTSLKGVLGTRIIELTGDSAPDALALKKANVIITTPEKWDGISRSWRTRAYVKSIGLIIMDEIHLIGQDRGPVLEVIVSRMRYVSSQTATHVRMVGLSTALSNAKDLADWLGISPSGLFNFEPKARPVPLTVHVTGYPGKHYCPRMATMNKPTYAAIMSYSPRKPTLVFVSSRRQTRLTALDLINFTTADGNPRKFLNMENAELELPLALARVRDPHLKHCLEFGIGMHHAGLTSKDRQIVEELFLQRKILVLVCTSTLAWGVNLPAYLVVVKGTEYYDAKTHRYVDFPITDVLQMMGRAGRPQYDTDGKACVLVHEPKKNFYLKFLHHPFPVESSLHKELHDNLNAEIVGGTITSVQGAVDYLSWTFFFRRLLMNPSYYGLDDKEPETINEYLLGQIRVAFSDLESAGCIAFVEKDDEMEVAGPFLDLKEMDACKVIPLSLGNIASYYYLQYTTVGMFTERLDADLEIHEYLDVLCSTSEFDELPVRHNEDKLNEELSKVAKWPLGDFGYDDPHFKANLLLQARCSRAKLPISDYVTDTISVLGQSQRILQAMIDICAEAGWLQACIHIMNITQMIVQGRWLSDSTLLNLPHMTDGLAALLWKEGIQCLPQLMDLQQRSRKRFNSLIARGGLREKQQKELQAAVARLPIVDVNLQVQRQQRSRKDNKDAGDDEKEWGTPYQVTVSARRNGKGGRHAWAPTFPRAVQEGWWLVLGYVHTKAQPDDPHITPEDELVALKRVKITNRHSFKLDFQVPLEAGDHNYCLLLMSDCYLGLDQQYAFTVTQKAEEVAADDDATD